MRKYVPSLVSTALGIIFVAALWFGGVHLLARHDAHTVQLVDDEVSKQKAVLVYVADLTRQNSADDATNKIVADCNTTDRQRFDTLLDLLSKNISETELKELNGLFYQCGRFYAERKAMMASRLTREVTTYKTLKNLRAAIQADNVDYAPELAAWQSIADAEQKWADYFNELVTHQGTIITLLLEGKRTTSPEVVAVLGDASAARQQMELLGIQIQGYRETLSKI